MTACARRWRDWLGTNRNECSGHHRHGSIAGLDAAAEAIGVGLGGCLSCPFE